MHDPRIDQLASQLVNYSTAIQSGDKVLIDAFDVPEAVPIALVRAVRAAGGTAFVNLNNAQISRELLLDGTDEQYDIQAELGLAQMEKMNAYIAIRGSHNITESSDVPEDKITLAMKKLRPVQDHRINKTRWCVLRWPTASMAQQAQMSTEAFEDFYFQVCLLDYAALRPPMQRLQDLMSATDDVHITGPGTDLKFSMAGLGAIACGGDRNIPDGECFSAPVKDSVEGVLTYNTPTLYRGIAFDNMRLEFEKGKIIKAEASNSDAFNQILDSDDGARFIGEFAIGFNPKIMEPMRDILFDEKIAGSFHFTPGQAYEGVADNGNRSQVHWDMVNIQRPDYGGGEIYFDGKLIRKDGQFTLPELEELNY